MDVSTVVDKALKVHGKTEAAELRTLYEWAEMAPDGAAVEVGALHGRSVLVWAAARWGRGVMLVVDDEARDMLKRTLPDGVRLVKGTSWEEADKAPSERPASAAATRQPTAPSAARSVGRPVDPSGREAGPEPSSGSTAASASATAEATVTPSPTLGVTATVTPEPAEPEATAAPAATPTPTRTAAPTAVPTNSTVSSAPGSVEWTIGILVNLPRLLPLRPFQSGTPRAQPVPSRTRPSSMNRPRS